MTVNSPNDGATGGAFGALRHRNYRLFFFGQLLSVLGTWTQATALPLLIVKLAPQQPGLWLGLNGFLPLVPLLLLTLIAGSLVDRYPKRTIIVLTQTVLMLQAVTLAWLAWRGAAQLWHILALAVVSGASQAVDLPARKSFVIEMVGSPDDLSSALALDAAVFNLGRAIGPLVAGFLVAAVDFGAAFLVNGLSFVAVIVGLLLMRLPPHVQPTAPTNIGAHLQEGLLYLRQSPMHLLVMSLVGVSAFLSMPFLTLMPIFANKILVGSAQSAVSAICGVVACRNPSAVTMGLLMGMFGMGAVTGALLIGTYGNLRRGKLLTMGNILFPSALLVFAVSRSLWLSLMVLPIVGVAFVFQNALASTLVQVMTPRDLRGRTLSVYALVFQGMLRAGGMQAGFMETLVGAPLTIAAGAILSLGYGLLLLVKCPQLRALK